jgi:hypothetical protein
MTDEPPQQSDQPIVERLEPRRLMAATLPRPDHVVIVVEENKDYRDVLGPGLIPPSLNTVIPPSTFDQAPYMRSLAKHGANFVNAHGIAHPSQPNYLALFSGSTQGISSDTPPTNLLPGPSLGGKLLAAGFTFTGYSESLPAVGSHATSKGEYARKHNPMSDFADVPTSDNRPFSDFPTDFTKLPTVSIVVPNQIHDMHSGSIVAADRWLKSNLSDYVGWAQTHNSLLIVTWDEGRSGNHIPTFMDGQVVRRGTYHQHITHFNMFTTLEDMYGLSRGHGKHADAAAITSPFITTSPMAETIAAPQSIFSSTLISASATNDRIATEVLQL